VKKSKVDAIIRRKAEEAARDGYSRGSKDERSKYEMLMMPAEGVAVLGAIPEQMLVRVYLRGHDSVAMDYRDMPPSYAMYNHHVQTATFKAVQKCWATKNGPTVSWYEWQFMGLN
jgi:hypothetical protein